MDTVRLLKPEGIHSFQTVCVDILAELTLPLWAALQVATWRNSNVPRWKRWRLKNQEKDKEQRKAYYWRNRDKIALNSRIRYQREKGAKSGDL